MISMDEIYKQHAKMIYYFILSKTNSPDIAEELTQETFYQAINSLSSFEGKSSVSTWLCGIAENVYHTWLRKQKKEQDNENIDDVVSINYEDNTNIEWDNKAILKQLHKLNDPIKEVMYLRLISNLSFKDIGEIMDKSENWARVNYYRGKEKILEEMKNE